MLPEPPFHNVKTIAESSPKIATSSVQNLGSEYSGGQLVWFFVFLETGRGSNHVISSGTPKAGSMGQIRPEGFDMAAKKKSFVPEYLRWKSYIRLRRVIKHMLLINT